MIPLCRRFLAQVALAHLALALILNAPALTGKVPLTVWAVNAFPPWEGVPEASTPHEGNTGTSDLPTAIYPWRVFMAESLKNGALPAWNPYLLSGTPFIANAQSAVFYPPNWLYALIPPATAWTILQIFHTAVAGIFAAALTRALGANPAGAVLAGFVFTMSGFMTGWRGYPMGDAAMWLPLALFAVLRLTESPGTFYTILLSVAWAMPALAGHPETTAHIAMVSSVFAIFGWFTLPRERGIKRRYVAAILCSALFSLGLAACQILPTAEWLRHTTVSLDYRWSSIPLQNALAILVRSIRHHPNNIGLPIPEQAAYVSVIALPLACLAFLKDSRRVAAFFGALCLVAAGIVYGVQPFRWISSVTPILAGIKNGRLLFVIDLSLAVLAGIGFSRWMEGVQSKRAVIITLVSGTIVGAGLWVVHGLETKPDFAESAALTAVFLALGLAAMLLGSTAARTSRIAAGFVFALAAADAISVTHGFVSFVPASKIYPDAPLFDFLKAHVRPGDRIASVDTIYPVNTGMTYGLRSIDGYDVELKNVNFFFQDFTERAEIGVVLDSNIVADRMDRRLDLLSMRYLIAFSGSPGLNKLLNQPEQYALVFSAGNLLVFENLRSRGPFTLIPVSNVEIRPVRPHQLIRLRQPDFDPASSVILPSMPDSFPTGTAGGGSFGIEEVSLVSHEEKRLKATAATPGVVVLNEMYYPGWKVTVDGSPQPLLLADYALMGVAVGPGTHDIVFKFDSRTIAGGIAVSLITVLTLVLLLPKIRVLAAVVVGVALIVAVALAEKPIPLPDTPPPVLEISQKEVVAGQDSYTLRIESLSGSLISLRFSINDEKPVEYDVPLNALGEIEFDVPAETRKGTYRFLAFRKARDSAWIEANVSIVVR